MNWLIALELVAAFAIGVAFYWALTMWRMWKWYANKR